MNGGEAAKVDRACERMAADRLAKRADGPREEGRRRRGRWEDCVKRDVRKAGVERKLEGKAHDRGEWRKIVENATEKL